ncbi:MAG: hypothetical protein WDM80_11250 [Limisphaerales bacterium]
MRGILSRMKRKVFVHEAAAIDRNQTTIQTPRMVGISSWGRRITCRASKSTPGFPSNFRTTKSAHDPDDKADHKDQAKPAAANDGTAKVKPAAAEQEKQNNQDQ